MLNWIIWNRTVFDIKTVFTINWIVMFNCLNSLKWKCFWQTVLMLNWIILNRTDYLHKNGWYAIKPNKPNKPNLFYHFSSPLSSPPLYSFFSSSPSSFFSPSLLISFHFSFSTSFSISLSLSSLLCFTLFFSLLYIFHFFLIAFLFFFSVFILFFLSPFHPTNCLYNFYLTKFNKNTMFSTCDKLKMENFALN